MVKAFVANLLIHVQVERFGRFFFLSATRDGKRDEERASQHLDSKASKPAGKTHDDSSGWE
jgi:hypothetical protein